MFQLIFFPDRSSKRRADSVLSPVLKRHKRNYMTWVQMTHRCLLANRGNVQQRLLVAHFHYFSFLCRNEHWNTIRHVLLNCVDEKSRLLPAAFLAFSLASSLDFLLASISFFCCSILSSFHRLLICKPETVSFSLNAVMGHKTKSKCVLLRYLKYFWRWVKLGVLVDAHIAGG